MAEINPPVHLQNDGADSDAVRRWMSTIAGDTEGVVDLADLEVTEKSGTPNMSIDVVAGRALILGTQAATQGLYFVENDATVNRAITAADPTNDRIDIVIAQMRDSAYAGVDNDWRVTVVTGTPDPSPEAPALPDDSLLLATVTVGAGVTAIVNAALADGREVWSNTGSAWAPRIYTVRVDDGPLLDAFDVISVGSVTMSKGPKWSGLWMCTAILTVVFEEYAPKSGTAGVRVYADLDVQGISVAGYAYPKTPTPSPAGTGKSIITLHNGTGLVTADSVPVAATASCDQDNAMHILESRLTIVAYRST